MTVLIICCVFICPYLLHSIIFINTFRTGYLYFFHTYIFKRFIHYTFDYLLSYFTFEMITFWNKPLVSFSYYYTFFLYLESSRVFIIKKKVYHHWMFHMHHEYYIIGPNMLHYMYKIFYFMWFCSYILFFFRSNAHYYFRYIISNWSNFLY